MAHAFIYLLFCLIVPQMLLAIPIQPYHTTAFIEPFGSLDILTSVSTYEASRFWNSEGKTLPTFNNFRSQSYLLYAEYAMNAQNSVFFNGGYTQGKAKMDGKKLGFVDPEVGWKHLLQAGKTSALALQVIGVISSGKSKPLIRYGAWGGEIGLLYSDLFTVLKKDGWYDLGLSYRFYEGFPSDQVRSYASVGYDLFCSFSLIGSLLLDYGVYNGKNGYHANHILLNPKYRLLQARGECRWSPVSFLTFTLGGYGHVWGRNISKGGGVLGGIWIDL